MEQKYFYNNTTKQTAKVLKLFALIRCLNIIKLSASLKVKNLNEERCRKKFQFNAFVEGVRRGYFRLFLLLLVVVFLHKSSLVIMV